MFTLNNLVCLNQQLSTSILPPPQFCILSSTVIKTESLAVLDPFGQLQIQCHSTTTWLLVGGFCHSVTTSPFKLVVHDWLLSAYTFLKFGQFWKIFERKLLRTLNRIRCRRSTAFLGTLWALSAQSMPRKAADSVLS